VKQVHVAVDAHNLARDDRGIAATRGPVLSRAHATRAFAGRTWCAISFRGARRSPARSASRMCASRGASGGCRRRVVSLERHVLRTNVPAVATIHDAAPFAFPATDARKRAIEQNPFLATAATASRILVQSRFTAGEVEGRLGVEAERVVVTPLAADPVFTPGALDALPAALRGTRYVLHVGAHDERRTPPR